MPKISQQKAGFLQARTTKPGSSEIGALQVETAEVDSAQIGASKVRTSQIAIASRSQELSSGAVPILNLMGRTPQKVERTRGVNRPVVVLVHPAG
ncbi:MAG: hypothetical protein V3W41_07880 [Planctomycetota bacterium]